MSDVLQLPTTQLAITGKLRRNEHKTLEAIFGSAAAVYFDSYYEFIQSKLSERPTVVIDTHSDLESLARFKKERVKLNNVEIVDLLTAPNDLGTRVPKNIFMLGKNAQQLLSLAIEAEQKLIQRIPATSRKNFEVFPERFGLYGTSPAFIKALSTIQKIRKSDSRVLIKGETGTGKELAARAVHYLSKRESGPFVPVNCGAFSDELLLSELFGHKKGAFTGATQDQIGLLELADGGTLFLDEVDALSSKAQVSLLRYLQEGEIRALGSRKFRKVDVRIISATNRQLSKLVKSGDFRDDLLYRLDVLSINLPPLRARGEDLFSACMQILSQLANELGEDNKVLSGEVLAAIFEYDWPGNFRELESSLTRAFLMTEGQTIQDTALLLSEEDYESSPLPSALGSFNKEKQLLIDKFEKNYIESVLAKTSGNVSRAAFIAKKERRSFSRLMEKHGIKREKFVA